MMRSFLLAVWKFIRTWFARVGVMIIAGCLVLEYFGFPIADKFIPALVALLLVGIYEIILEAKNWNHKAADELAALTHKVTDLGHAANRLISQLSPKLYALFECKEELESILDGARLGEKVVIDHLGLDMHQAWEYVHQLLFGRGSKLTDIEYRLLILSGTKRDTWPAEVQDWSDSVPRSLRRIEGDLKKVTEQFQQAGKRCKIEVRQYDAVPIVHGWSVRQPIKTWHVSFCRWSDDHYDWGEHHYIKVDQFTRTPIVGDIADIFDGYFERFWSMSSEQTRLRFQSTN